MKIPQVNKLTQSPFEYELAENNNVSATTRNENKRSREIDKVNRLRQEDAEGDDTEEGIKNERVEKQDDKLFNDNVAKEAEWFRGDDESQVVPIDIGNVESSEDSDIDNEDDLKSCEGSDGENDVKNFPIFNTVEYYDPTFELDMIFSNRDEIRQAIHSQAIKTKRNLKITKNDNVRMYAKCADMECGWKFHALKLTGKCTYQIRQYEPNHTCGMSFRIKNLKSSWLSRKYANKIRSDPKRNVKGFQVDIMEDLRCRVSDYQAYRAKSQAIELVEGQVNSQYALLWDFANEIKRTNPGSTIIVGIEEANCDNRFDRLYMCLYASKVGFLSGCRHFIGVDGCHLKGPHGGVLLTAVGVDPNNSNFPIAFAIVNNKTGETWGWFLSLLKLDLNIEKDYEWTFMSDKQKGLVQAINEVFPSADHRFCVRHLHENFKRAGFRGQAFKIALWNCAMATTVNEFGRRMEILKELDKSAVE
ncbi:uncharacterized protein [Henckelia pumila]|uniref:uncharacterized protein n=1 Tax=Henckelia pumila TaxID=405737 RepID=UPI003C6E4E34